MLTKTQITKLLELIQQHENSEDMCYLLENTICQELDVRGADIVSAYLSNDVDAMLVAFTGWSMESLLAKANIIPPQRIYCDNALGTTVPVFQQIPGET